MLKLLVLCLIAVVVTHSHTIHKRAPAGGYKRVCYHTNWSQYRPEPGKFFPEDIDPCLCTHMIYAFANLVNGELKAFEWNDDSEEWMKLGGMYERFNRHKQQNPGLKTLLAVGGWNMASAPFTRMVATQQTRSRFIQQAIKFLRDRNFDGLDLDWEYPALRGAPAGDKQKFTMLVKELRQAFEAEAQQTGKPRLLLTAAVAAGKSNIDTAYEIPAISRDLDFINLMAYDLHGSWEKFTGMNAPLHARSSETGDQKLLNVEWAANYWNQQGAPKEKLIIGLGVYGRSFTLANTVETGPGAPVRGAGNAGKYTREKGFLAYYEICQMIKNGGTKVWDNEHKTPYVHLGDQWVGFDDQKSLKIKTDWIKQNGFGGGMIWALDLDDFDNLCGEGKYPLSTTIARELGGSTCNAIQPPTGPTGTTPKPVLITTTPSSGTWTWKPPVTPRPGSGVITTKPPMTPRPGSGVTTMKPPMTPRPGSGVTTMKPPMTPRPGSGVTTMKPPTQWTWNPVTKPSTKAPIVNTPDGYRPGFKFAGCANLPDGHHPDPDCTKFHQCTFGQDYEMSCGPGTIFDNELKICSWPYLVGRRCEGFYKQNGGSV